MKDLKIHFKILHVLLLMLITAAVLQAGEIHDAAAAGDLNKVRALIEADSTLLESKDVRLPYSGNTPLISACWGPPSSTPQAQVAIANYLIDKGANIKAKNDKGATPLYFATKSFDLTQRLIAMGADVNIRAYGHYTPLHHIAFSGNLKVAKLLIEHGADLNASGEGGTILQEIIYYKIESSGEMAKLLLESGAKLQEFSFGNTELHLAAINDYADINPILIRHGADVNAVNEYNRTALYYAAVHGHRKAAEALIAAGADRSAIVESNYGKAPQLAEKLRNGEAFLWYLGGNESPYTGYAVKTKDHLLIFNPSDIDESLEAGLANGYINRNELAGQKITALISYQSYQGRFGQPSISELAKRLPSVNFVLNFKPAADSAGNNNMLSYKLTAPHESFSMDGIQVHTIPAMQRAWFGGEGLGYLVEADGVKIFHAGLHACSSNEAEQMEKYRKEIDFLKPFGPIDIAILPVRGRHIWLEYEPYLYLIDQLSPKAIYLIGDDLAAEEHRKCVEVIRVRNVPVAYPDGGIAVGQRFHFLGD
jgi:ankyrin repeat protein